MHKHMRTVLVIIFLLQYSCLEKSNELLPVGEQKISLNSLFSKNEIVKIQASYSADVTDVHWNTDFSDAGLILTVNRDTIQTAYLDNGLFQSITGISSEIHYVSFSFIKGNDTLTGFDIIPENPSNVIVSYYNDLFIDDVLPQIPLKIEYTKVQDEAAYYEVEVFMIADETIQKCELRSSEPVITSQGYYPEIDAFAKNHLTTLVFPAKLANTEKQHIQILYASPIIVQESTGRNYIPEHQIVVYFRRISENYYKYKSSYLEQIIKREGDIIFGGSSGIEVFSNISGGYGIFAGYSEFSDTIEVERIYF